MRANPILLFLSTALIPLLLKAQLQIADGTQLKVLFPSSTVNSYYASDHFNKRFERREIEDVKIIKTDVYVQQHVKRILVYEPEAKLKYTFDLDTTGKIIGGSQPGTYYRCAWSNLIVDQQHFQSSESYYDSQNKLIRTDSTFIESHQYKNADTLMSTRIQKQLVYKRGSLINEQNKYYNEKWLYARVNLSGTYGVEIIPYLKFLGKEYYLEDRLKTKYKSDSLYSCLSQCIEQQFWASKANGGIELKESAISKHTFYKSHKLKFKKKYLVDGEDFEEPYQYVTNDGWCNTTRYAMSEIEDRRYESYRFSRNNKGLYDTCYYFNYPLVPIILTTGQDSAKQAEFVAGIENGTNLVLDSRTASGKWRRSENPEKKVKYLFKYEYFESVQKAD